MTLFLRHFTIHFDNNVYETSVDCRVTRTLRELLITALPPPLNHSVDWVENCACCFGGQRLSLSAATNVAPTTLYVALAAHSRTEGGKTTVSGHAESLKRRRSMSIAKSETNTPEGGSGGDENNNNNHKNSNYEEDEESYEEEEEDSDEEEEPRSSYNSRSSSGAKWRERAGDSDDDSDDSIHCDDRQREAVLPIIVGGVVRLINSESRDKSHQWTVYIRGLFNETDYLAQCIESVRFILDPSFTPCERIVRTAPFELTEVGWGEFIVKMQVQLRHYPRPITVMLSSSSFDCTTSCESEIKEASSVLSSPPPPIMPLSGLTRGPILSPVVNVLSRHRYCSEANAVSSSSTAAAASGNSQRGMVKAEVKVEKDEFSNETGHNFQKDTMQTNEVRHSRQSAIAEIGMSPGIVTLSHLLRFSHRPRRPHCIPPDGRPFEREEYIGYIHVDTPVVTEQYDEIVVPDPPAPIMRVAEALPNMLCRRIATVKTARAIAQESQRQEGYVANSGVPPFSASAAFNENGVSCWEYIRQVELEDTELAESYLCSVGVPFASSSGTQHIGSGSFASVSRAGSQQQEHEHQPHLLYGNESSPIVVRQRRGRRKLSAAERDLSVLKSIKKTAKKGLVDAIEKLRREWAVRQAAQTYEHYK